MSNILQQLELVNLSKEEIECGLDNAEHTTQLYDKNMRSFKNALEAFNLLRDNSVIDANSDNNIKQLESDFEAYQASNTEKCECLKGFVEKLKLLRDIL